MKKLNIFKRLDEAEGRLEYLEEHKMDKTTREALETLIESKSKGNDETIKNMSDALLAVIEYLDIHLQEDWVVDKRFPDPQPRRMKIIKAIKNPK